MRLTRKSWSLSTQKFRSEHRWPAFEATPREDFQPLRRSLRRGPPSQRNPSPRDARPQLSSHRPLSWRKRTSRPPRAILRKSRGWTFPRSRAAAPAGAIAVLADVERIIDAPFPEKRTIGIDLDAMRAAIAAAMARSKQEIPHYYLEHQVDVTPCEDWLARINDGRAPGERIVFTALAISESGGPGRAALSCLQWVLQKLSLRTVRGGSSRGGHRHSRRRPSGARHAETPISWLLDETMARLRDLVQRTRAGRLRSSEIGDPTITVSSAGDREVEALFGVIYPPQVALVGFGKPVPRPWIVDGAIAPRSVVTITLSADHRVSDGHAGALFLAEIGRLLQEPDTL